MIMIENFKKSENGHKMAKVWFVLLFLLQVFKTIPKDED